MIVADFRSIINQLKSLWNLSQEEYKILYKIFVISKRLSAFRSLILLKERQYFKEEVNYWNKSTYMGYNGQEKIIILILKSKFIPIKYYLCHFIFMIIRLRYKTIYKKLIYKDLNNRSIRM